MRYCLKLFQSTILLFTLCVAMTACQKMERPTLGDYPEDTNPPGGPLKFYAAYDESAVDSIRATFPADNPLTFTDGISGKALQGENRKFVKYVKPNDWAALSESFTLSFWLKRDGQTKNNKGTNGPEYIFSLPSSNEMWSKASMMVFLEGNNAKTGVKVWIGDAAKAENWFTWEGDNTISGVLDNQWHHMALVYDAATSTMTLYVDGVANPNARKWGTHGAINIDNSKITEFRVGAGPAAAADETDDWLASTWKGALDQLRLYSTPLSAAEIATLHTSKM